MAQFVKYVGTSHIREISVKDWQDVGVTDQQTVRWDAANNWMVPLDRITTSAWPYIDADPELILVTQGGMIA